MQIAFIQLSSYFQIVSKAFLMHVHLTLRDVVITHLQTQILY